MTVQWADDEPEPDPDDIAWLYGVCDPAPPGPPEITDLPDISTYESATRGATP